MNIKKDILWRAYVVVGLVVILAGAVVWRIADIQYVEGSRWRTMADSLTTSYRSIESKRGNIYSADGSLMATSLPIYEIRLDLMADGLSRDLFYSKVDTLSHCLSDFFEDQPATAYKRTLIQQRRKGERYFLLKRNINHNELKKLRQFPIFRRGRYGGGFIAREQSKRIKPLGKLASRTLGYKVDGVQGVGLEGAYNQYLTGREGKRLMQKVRNGKWIPINAENELEPEDGKDLITTLNTDIQDVAESALSQTLRKHQAAHGCAVVMEVETGKVKAIANLGRNKDGSYTENYNYAIGESLEPGSTFKLASAVALLEDGYYQPGDSLRTGDGSREFYGYEMQDARQGGYGTITFERAFEVSSNVGFSTAIHKAYKDNPGAYIQALKDLRLHKRLDIPLQGTGKPVIKSPDHEDWSSITLPWMAIGYGVRLTPLQLLAFYNGIANDGTLVKPRFVKSIREVGKTVRDFEKSVLKPRMCSEETAQQARDMLAGVVQEGTAANLQTKAYQIAGKTGTAKIANGTGYAPGDHNYQASFVGFFPKENPQYSCIVVVNRPTQGLYYGARVAGPVFREIADKIYAYDFPIHEFYPEEHQNSQLHLPPIAQTQQDKARQLCQALGLPFQQPNQPLNWIRATASQGQALKLKEQSMSAKVVPDVRGMVLADALYALEKRGLEVKASGKGEVIAQSVRPGTSIRAYNAVKLTLR